MGTKPKKIVLPKGAPRLRGVPLFGCVVHDLVDQAFENSVCKHHMELKDRVREAMSISYDLGKATTRAYYKKQSEFIEAWTKNRIQDCKTKPTK